MLPAGSLDVSGSALRRVTPLLAAVLLAASAGCESITPATCDPSAANNPTVSIANAPTQTQDGVYMSSPWVGPLLTFPAGMHYSLAHGLGSTPAWIQPYLSFQQDGSALAQPAGNQVEILGVDEETIELSNGSCVPYWLLVTAGAGP